MCADKSILDDWSHEGPDDPEGDERLLLDALAISARYKMDKSGCKNLDEVLEEDQSRLASTNLASESLHEEPNLNAAGNSHALTPQDE